MHRVASIENLPDLVRVAVDEGQLAGIAQGDGEDVLEIDVVHLLLRPFGHWNDELPAVLHVLEGELWRNIRRILDVARHQVDFFLGEDVVVVDHATFGSVGDDLLQTFGPQAERAAFEFVAVFLGLFPVRLQVLAGGALAQHAVTAGASLEVDFLGDFLFRGGHRRGARISRCVVTRMGYRQPHQSQRGNQCPCELLAEWHGVSP
ncbi:hypothetical protein D3C78_1020480 [compost metagenome]